MKIKFKQNEHKEFLKNELKNTEAYLAKLGPGEEYDEYFAHWQQLNEELRKMSFGNKVKEALPWLTLGVTAVAGIFVPIYGMNKAYQKEEVEGELSNGKVWSIATKKTKN